MINKTASIIIDKPWGCEEIICTNDRYTLKKISMLKNKKCSLQYHKNKTETIHIKSGIMELTYGSDLSNLEIEILGQGTTVEILPNIIHRMKAIEDLEYIEVSTSELDDIFRIRDDYGRV